MTSTAISQAVPARGVALTGDAAAGKACLLDIPAAEYHADRSRVTRGQLATFAERRRVYEATYIVDPPVIPPTIPSDAMRLGSAVHSAILEPYRFGTDVVAYPKQILDSRGYATTKAAKEFRKHAEAQGHTVLKPLQMAQALAISTALYNSDLGRIIHTAKHVYREKVIQWTDPETELPCACRPDALIVTDTGATIIDLKITPAVAPREFRRKAVQFAYWLQDAHYSAGIREWSGKPTSFYFLACEPDPPWTCATHALEPKTRLDSDTGYRELLRDFAECKAAGDWREPWEGRINRFELWKGAIYERDGDKT